MRYPNSFEASTLEENKKRLAVLTATSQPEWGKMDVAQMLAHVNVTYQIAKGEKQVNINPVMRLMFKMFLKKTVVGDKPYAKNLRTAPFFLMADEKDFENEKARLLENIQWAYTKGTAYFDGKKSDSFGELTAAEWSCMFQKHLDHHFSQFGV